MIWVGGRIVPEEAPDGRRRDRTFEHGLGLFETFGPGTASRRCCLGTWRGSRRSAGRTRIPDGRRGLAGCRRGRRAASRRVMPPATPCSGSPCRAGPRRPCRLVWMRRRRFPPPIARGPGP